MIRLFRQPIVRWLTLMGCCELLLLAASLNAATWIRFAPSPEDLAASSHSLTARAAMFAIAEPILPLPMMLIDVIWIKAS